MKPCVVVDKSYLLGASKTELGEIFDNFVFVMTEALFFELLTTSESQRRQCFARIPQVTNPVLLISNIGPILQWEVKNRRPLTDLREIAQVEKFRFNPNLPNEGFYMGEAQSNALVEWKAVMAEWVRNFSEHSSATISVFEALKEYAPGQDTTVIEELKERVVSERDMVESFYDQDYENWPEFDLIDSSWALYTHLQIRLVAALDYYKRYGNLAFSNPNKYIENEYIDLEYCLVGCICGALATRDGVMASRFKALRENGLLIQ